MPPLPQSNVRIYTPDSMQTSTATNVYGDAWGRWVIDTSTTAGTSDVTVYANWIRNDRTFALNDVTSTTSSNNVVWREWVVDPAMVRAADVMQSWVGATINAQNLNAMASDIHTVMNARGAAAFEHQVVGVPPTPADTAELRASRERYERNVRAFELRNKRLKEERLKADNLAEELLRSCLNEEQKRELSERDWFLVMTQSGKIYRINRGRVGNVDLLDENGKPIASFCIHNSGHTPSPDDMLLQKFLLDTDEEEFKRIANHRGAPYGSNRSNVVDISRFRRAA